MADGAGSTREPRPTTLRRSGLGALALRGRPYDILWNCTLSNALIGVGLLAGRSRPVAIGVTWLCLGDPADLVRALAAVADAMARGVLSAEEAQSAAAPRGLAEGP